MKPIIAVTPSLENGIYKLNAKYIEAIIKNGGIPFVLGYGDITEIDYVLSRVNGLLLSGGGDLNPSYYRQSAHLKTKITEKIRDEYEILLCRRAIPYNLPMLAICRGIQVLNVALSGTLKQHIENHSYPNERHSGVHFININKESKLFNILGTEKIKVNSIHHQAIGKVSQFLEASAVSEDDVIEAVELKGTKFTIGVQWHPEALLDTDKIHNLLFRSFVRACEV